MATFVQPFIGNKTLEMARLEDEEAGSGVNEAILAIIMCRAIKEVKAEVLEIVNGAANWPKRWILVYVLTFSSTKLQLVNSARPVFPTHLRITLRAINIYGRCVATVHYFPGFVSQTFEGGVGWAFYHAAGISQFGNLYRV